MGQWRAHGLHRYRNRDSKDLLPLPGSGSRSPDRGTFIKPEPSDSPEPDRPIKREAFSRSMAPPSGWRTISVKREFENKPPLELNFLRGRANHQEFYRTLPDGRKRKRSRKYAGPLPKRLRFLGQSIKDQASKANIFGPTMISDRVRPIEAKSESLVAPKSVSPAPQKPRSSRGGLDVLLEAIEQESKSKPPPALERASDKSVRFPGFHNVSVFKQHDLEKSG